MKIEIKSPFKGIWKHAYVVKNKENRNMVCLVNSRKERTTIALARYNMSVKLGRELTKDETVDHIDNDPTNDDINNLQILSSLENIQKYRNTLPSLQHGTNQMYRNGCRCDTCKKWKSDYQKAYRNSHPEFIEKTNKLKREKRQAN